MANQHSMSPLQRIAAALFSIALVVALVPAVAFAASSQASKPQIIASKTVGSVKWELDSAGTLSIFPANGKVGTYGLDYTNDESPWADVDGNNYTRKITAVKFGSGIKLQEYIPCMFKGCSELKYIDFNDVDATELQDMKSLFSGCENLIAVDFSKFDTKNLESMDNAFFDCANLMYVNLSGIDTKRPWGEASMSSLFADCKSLTRVVTGENFLFDTRNSVRYALPEGEWFSESTGKTYTSDQIITRQFDGEADTYTNLSVQYGTPSEETGEVDVSTLPAEMTEPQILEVTPVTWAKGSKDDATFTSTALVYLLDDVLVDDDSIAATNYTVSSGSTIVKLKASYLQTLDEGTHTISIKSANGTASTDFTVAKDPSTEKPSASTKPSASSSSSKPSASTKPSASSSSSKPSASTKPETPKDDGSQQSSEKLIPMYRLYNPNSGEHFYTSSRDERAVLVYLGWRAEGIAWDAPASGTPVYRLYNPKGGEHHYTTSNFERGMLVGKGWNDEGIGWYADTQKRVKVYRVYNPNAYANNHHYTTDAGERNVLIALGWKDEGIGWHAAG